MLWSPTELLIEFKDTTIKSKENLQDSQSSDVLGEKQYLPSQLQFNNEYENKEILLNTSEEWVSSSIVKLN
jgi:hypothetical protein